MYKYNKNTFYSRLLGCTTFVDNFSDIHVDRTICSVILYFIYFPRISHIINMYK